MTPDTNTIPPLRWLVETWSNKHWDDRDKEYDVHSGKRHPVLQYHNGKEWINVPTVEQLEDP